MDTDYFEDKRCEYRIPITMPVTFFKADTTKPLKGDIENVSSRGALARAAIPLPKDTVLKLFFKIPGTEEQVESGGEVRWSTMNHGSLLGIEFQEKVSFNLPLYVVTRLFHRSATKTPTDYSYNQWDLLQKCIKELQHFTYWGAMLWTFSDPIHTLFSQLAGQIGLSSFRLEKFCRQMEGFLADPKLKCAIEESVSALEPASGRFNEAVSVLGLLKKRRHMDLTKSKYSINLNHLIRDKIIFFQGIVMRLANKKCNMNYLPGKDLPSVYGQYSDFAQCIDFLLLYSYQSIMFGSCGGVTVQSMVKNETIQLNFFNDGTKIFEKADIVIDHISGDFVDQLTARDVKNISGLYYSLIPLKKYNAYIVMHSESGNNIISLRIPLSAISHDGAEGIGRRTEVGGQKSEVR